jgi:hypothetical protein
MHVKYVLMFCDTEQYTKNWETMSQSERDQAYERVHEWFAQHADKITHSGHLHRAHTATTVRLEGGEPVVTDGPFVEGKEVISGFVEIDVADLDEALRMAKIWPACPTVEIRPLA